MPEEQKIIGQEMTSEQHNLDSSSDSKTETKNAFSTSKLFFFLSFFPALLYWYLEEYYPIRIALVGGITLSIIEIVFEYIFTKEVHTLSKFNFILVVVLGGLSLLANEGIWFKMQPFFTSLFMGGFIYYQASKNRGLFLPIMEQMKKPLPPEEIILSLEKHVAIFFIGYGGVMAFIALHGATSQWLFFKTAGLYASFFIFFIAEYFYLRIKMAKLIRNQRKAMIDQIVLQKISEKQKNSNL